MSDTDTDSSTAFPASFPLSAWATLSQRSVLQEMLKTASRPGLISFALGLPAADLFPTKEFAASVAEVLARDPRALQYEPASRDLRAYVAALMGQRGVSCDERDVFVTTGSQQALCLLSKLLLDPGGDLILEETVYPGLRSVIEPLRPRIWTVPTSPRDGIDVDAIEALLKRGVRPSFLYLSAEAQNPMAGRIPADRRERLVRLGESHRFPVVEDDAYGFLTYEDSARPALRSFSDGWVIYVGTFSKILAPALRVGWVVAPPHVLEKLPTLKEAGDIDTVTLSQRAVCAFLASNPLETHIAVLRREYRRRRDVMMQALDAHLSSVATWSVPGAGIFVWLEFPPDFDAGRLLTLALARGVAFLPGQGFFMERERRNCLRLSFPNCSDEVIQEGVRRLALAVGDYRAHSELR
jgi:2-aminoadipate transaminase